MDFSWDDNGVCLITAITSSIPCGKPFGKREKNSELGNGMDCTTNHVCLVSGSTFICYNNIFKLGPVGCWETYSLRMQSWTWLNRTTFYSSNLRIKVYIYASKLKKNSIIDCEEIVDSLMCWSNRNLESQVPEEASCLLQWAESDMHPWPMTSWMGLANWTNNLSFDFFDPFED